MTAPLVDHSRMKLGKKAPKRDTRTLRATKYLDLSRLPTAPDQCGWLGASQHWGTMGNDETGDCTLAAVGHHTQGWSKANGNEITIPDADILAGYSAVTGYNPNDPSTDQGAYELDVLNYWRKTGVGGHKIFAFADGQPTHHDLVKTSIWMFGGVYIGAGLPISAQRQLVWHVSNGPSAEFGSWGGHAVAVLAYSSAYLWCITWGEVKQMTWGWWDAYVDEFHIPMGPEWFNGALIAPSGFNTTQLQADLEAVAA